MFQYDDQAVGGGAGGGGLPAETVGALRTPALQTEALPVDEVLLYH